MDNARTSGWILSGAGRVDRGGARDAHLVTPLEAALRYAARGWPVFPCQWQGEGRKRPLVEHGLKAATTDTGIVTAWWARWSEALIGVPTGEAIGCVVLDIDRKEGGPDGLVTFGRIDC